jgi:hypothetical protein
MATDRYDVVAITAGDVRWAATGELEVTTNPYGLHSWTARIGISGMTGSSVPGGVVPTIVETEQGLILVGSAEIDLAPSTGSATPDVVSCRVHGTGDFGLI